MNDIKRKYIQSIIKKRKNDSNKSDYGHALIIAGQKGCMGAAVIAAKAGLRSGAGLLTVNVPTEERFIIQTAVPEAMLILREDSQYDLDKYLSIGIGPGIGINDTSKKMLDYVLNHFTKPIVLDADALTMLSADSVVMSKIPANTIITPHAKEFDRLFGIHQNNESRIDTAIAKATEYQLVIVLKGHRTSIICDGKVFYNTTGNAGLAKGGSGDALTGIISSLLAQGYSTLNAAIIGVFIHGLAADITLKAQSMESMLISDVIENLGKAFKKI